MRDVVWFFDQKTPIRSTYFPLPKVQDAPSIMFRGLVYCCPLPIYPSFHHALSLDYSFAAANTYKTLLLLPIVSALPLPPFTDLKLAANSDLNLR